MQVVVENLSFCYGKNSRIAKKALDNVSLKIEEGDFFGIVGKTGSGKSTFIQHLNGLIKIQKNSGKITVGEFDLNDKKCNYKALRGNIGMVFQYPEYQLFAETVFEDVAFGLKNFFPNLTDGEREQMVKSAIEMVGLDYYSVKDKSPFELSGGQKRRVAIAGVIVTRPKLLILDEPAAGLDPKGKREFLNLLKRLHKDFAKTVIIVSHDMNLIVEYCNKVAVFDEGKIVDQGSPKEIFLKENCAVYGLPVTAYLTKKLREKGIDLDNDLTTDDFVDKVIKAYGGIR